MSMCANGRARTCTNKRFHFSTLPRPPIDLTKPQRLDKLSTTPTSEPTPPFSQQTGGGERLGGIPPLQQGERRKTKANQTQSASYKTLMLGRLPVTNLPCFQSPALFTCLNDGAPKAVHLLQLEQIALAVFPQLRLENSFQQVKSDSLVE